MNNEQCADKQGADKHEDENENKKQDDGQSTWQCPTCQTNDEERTVIGCDKCDRWYHGECIDFTCKECKKKEVNEEHEDLDSCKARLNEMVKEQEQALERRTRKERI